MNEGIKKNKIETAKKMFAEALPVGLITRISGLPLAEINELKAQMTNGFSILGSLYFALFAKTLNNLYLYQKGNLN